MKKRPESRLKYIQDIGQCLIKDDIMTEKMKTDMDNVTNRWNKLSEQVSQFSIFIHESILFNVYVFGAKDKTVESFIIEVIGALTKHFA